MDSRLFIWPAFVWICAYLLVGRNAVRAVIEAEGRDPFALRGSNGWFAAFIPNPRVTKLVFDRSFPRSDYPQALQRKIRLTRLLFALSPVVLIVAFLLMVFY